MGNREDKGKGTPHLTSEVPLLHITCVKAVNKNDMISYRFTGLNCPISPSVLRFKGI